MCQLPKLLVVSQLLLCSCQSYPAIYIGQAECPLQENCSFLQIMPSAIPACRIRSHFILQWDALSHTTRSLGPLLFQGKNAPLLRSQQPTDLTLFSSRRLALLVAGDAAALLVFALLGKVSHAGTADFGVVQTAAPFLVGERLSGGTELVNFYAPLHFCKLGPLKA